MSDLEKQYPESKGALVLDKVFNSCILRFENGAFVYRAECIINILKDEFKQAIENGLLDLYGDYDLDESADIYAIEHFFCNMEGSLGPNYPIYEHVNYDEE